MFVHIGAAGVPPSALPIAEEVKITVQLKQHQCDITVYIIKPIQPLTIGKVKIPPEFKPSPKRNQLFSGSTTRSEKI